MWDSLSKTPADVPDGWMRSRYPGVELWFNSSDHLPPHFHASRVEDRRRAVPRKALSALREGAVRFRAALLAEWEAKVEVR